MGSFILHDLFQRMQSTPVKLPSQSPNKVAHPMSKSQQPQQTAPVKQSTSKVRQYLISTIGVSHLLYICDGNFSKKFT